MGFKEVMALRQAGDFEEALKLARADYEAGADQWSASALFWVLRDLASASLDNNRTDEATPLVNEMAELINQMGATAAMAKDTLTSLQQLTIAHNKEIQELLDSIKTEKNKYKEREKAVSAYQTALEWHHSEGLHPELHETFAEIIIKFLENKGTYISLEEFKAATEVYFGLRMPVEKTPDITILELVLQAKKIFGREISLINFLRFWDIERLTDKEWNSKGSKNSTRHAIESLITQVGRELMDTAPQTIPQQVLRLRELAEEHLTDDAPETTLLNARIHLVEGDKSTAYDLYRELLISGHEASAWAEFATLVDNPDLQQSILTKCLKEENNDYAEYLDEVHFALAKHLCRNKQYPNALRELNVLAQIAQEKSRQLPSDYDQVRAQIPDEVEQNRDNKTFYIHAARQAEEMIFSEIPEIPMLVADVIALKVGRPQKQVMPMLKLKSTDGKTALVSPRESGIRAGNNRGLVYMVKLLEREQKHNKVLLMTATDIEARQIFPIEIGYITGYSRDMHAYHLINTKNKHLYLPGSEDTFSVGEFVSYLRFTETIPQYNDKGKTGTLIREMLLDPQRIDPHEAVAHYPIVRAVVAQVHESMVYIVTDDGVQGSFHSSISPIDLTPGDLCALRGFIFRKKDKITGDTISNFVTLSMEPLPPDAL